MKLLDDTLKGPDGKWSRKSLTAFVAFLFALAYEFGAKYCGYEANQYVFDGLLLLTGATLGLTVWDKK